MPSCADCNHSKPCVTFRRCDLFLCDECEHLRTIDPPQPGDPPRCYRKTNDQKQSSVESNSSTPKPSTEGSTPQKCDGPSCSIKDGDATCSCFICHKDFHLICVGLSRRPPKTSNWCCKNCANFPEIIRKLYHEVRSLTATQQQLQLDHSQLKTSHETLKNENVQLHTELQSLKDSLENRQPTHIELNDPGSESPDSFACLIIGDSILRDLDDSSFEDTIVKSISGGTVSSVFNELEKRKDLATFNNIIVHAGTNDISKNISVDESVASMEAIITRIMLKAPTAKVFISGVCPRTKDQVSDKVEILNAAFKDLASRLDCQFIDSGVHMTYRNGNIDNAQLVDGLHLSARGVETLSTLFANSVEGLSISTEPWTEVIKKSRKPRESISDSNKFNSQRGSRDPSYTNSKSDTIPSYHRNLPRRQNHQRFNNYIPHDARDRDYHRNQNSYKGCYNCGLKNHNQSTCRHNGRIRCNKCNRLGHKANYCNVSNGNHGHARNRY